MPKINTWNCRLVAYTFLNVCEKITSFCQALKTRTRKKIGSCFSASRCSFIFVNAKNCRRRKAVAYSSAVQSTETFRGEYLCGCSVAELISSQQ